MAMAVAIMMDMPGVTADDYDRVSSHMDFQGAPDGAIAHVCMKTADGLRVFDVWESREDHDRFVQEHLRPALAAEGFEPRGDGPQEFEIHFVGTKEHMPASTG